MTEDKTIKALEKIKDKIANYEIKINKAYTGENDFTIIFNTVYSIIDTQIDITKGSRTDQTGAEEPKRNERTAKGRTKKSVVSSDKGRTARTVRSSERKNRGRSEQNKRQRGQK